MDKVRIEGTGTDTNRQNKKKKQTVSRYDVGTVPLKITADKLHDMSLNSTMQKKTGKQG